MGSRKKSDKWCDEIRRLFGKTWLRIAKLVLSGKDLTKIIVVQRNTCRVRMFLKSLFVIISPCFGWNDYKQMKKVNQLYAILRHIFTLFSLLSSSLLSYARHFGNCTLRLTSGDRNFEMNALLYPHHIQSNQMVSQGVVSLFTKIPTETYTEMISYLFGVVLLLCL